MSRMGRVVQEIMEMHDGEVPVGYTLSDYFRDVKKRIRKKQLQEVGRISTIFLKLMKRNHNVQIDDVWVKTINDEEGA